MEEAASGTERGKYKRLSFSLGVRSEGSKWSGNSWTIGSSLFLVYSIVLLSFILFVLVLVPRRVGDFRGDGISFSKLPRPVLYFLANRIRHYLQYRICWRQKLEKEGKFKLPFYLLLFNTVQLLFIQDSTTIVKCYLMTVVSVCLNWIPA